MGNLNTAKGDFSTAMGYTTYATGKYSTAMGAGNTAEGISSTAMGYTTYATADYSTAMGSFNVGLLTTLLKIGNGSDFVTRSNVLSVFKNGTVGIGTLMPKAPLHIAGSSAVNETNTRYFSYGTGSSVGVLPNGSYNIGLLADYDIVTKNSFVSAQTVTTSDARIKNIIGLSDNHQDLQTLRRIKITDYHYKDAVTWGRQLFKKVIAQQVEEVYPQAVRQQKSVIADIYVLAERVQYNESKKELTVMLSKDYGLKIGDKVELVDSRQGKVLAEITSVSGNGFIVGNWLFATDKIFVFGREVNDFRVVDYEAISMLGISAIQQLATEVDSLKKQLSEMDSVKKRLDVLEAGLSTAPSGK